MAEKITAPVLQTPAVHYARSHGRILPAFHFSYPSVTHISLDLNSRRLNLKVVRQIKVSLVKGLEKTIHY